MHYNAARHLLQWITMQHDTCYNGLQCSTIHATLRRNALQCSTTRATMDYKAAQYVLECVAQCSTTCVTMDYNAYNTPYTGLQCSTICATTRRSTLQRSTIRATTCQHELQCSTTCYAPQCVTMQLHMLSKAGNICQNAAWPGLRPGQVTVVLIY